MSKNNQTGRGLSREAKQLLILIGCVAVALVAVIGITVAVFFSQNEPTVQPSEDSDPGSVSSDPTSMSGDVIEESGYDKDEFVLDVDKYSGTLLSPTEDAGEEYVDSTLFIGDSNTYRYMMYAQTTLANDIGIVGMGIQDVLTLPCVKFKGYSDLVTIPQAVTIMQPRRIVICFGTNNADGGWTADYMAQQYAKMLDGIEDAWPYADIIISAVPPVAQVHQNNQITMSTIDSFNQALAALAEERGCKFLNGTEVLKDPKTGFAKDGYTVSDGIHLSQKGVEALFGYIRTHAWEGTDRRPTPLKSIPKRGETEPYVITNENPYTGTVAGSGTSSKPEGLEIIFQVNDEKMGILEGELEQIVPENKQCTEVVAKPKEGYVFVNWGCTVGRIDDNKAPKITFTSPGGFNVQKVIVTANFAKAGSTVTVKNNDTKAGTAGIVDSTNALLSSYDAKPGESVKLYAYVNEDSKGTHQFVGWFVREDNEEKLISAESSYTYTPTGSVEVTAKFQRIPYTTKVTSSDVAMGSVTAMSSNGKLTVTATAKEGYEFDHWTVNGQAYSGSMTIDILIDQDLDVVAHFKAKAGTETPPASSETTPPASSETTPPASSDTTPPASSEAEPPASSDAGAGEPAA